MNCEFLPSTPHLVDPVSQSNSNDPHNTTKAFPSEDEPATRQTSESHQRKSLIKHPGRELFHVILLQPLIIPPAELTNPLSERFTNGHYQ